VGISAREAARRTGLSESTIRRMVKRGIIEASTSQGKSYNLSEIDVEKVKLHKRNKGRPPK